MKKRIKMISHEQQRKEPWTCFAQQQQQAKTGVVTLGPDFGEDSQINEIAAVDPLRATLGAVAVLSVKAANNPRGVVIHITQNLQNGMVDVFPSGTAVAPDVTDVADAVAGTTKSAELTFDGGLKNNAPMTNAVANGTGISTQINAALAAAKPEFSVQSILNKVEDIVRAQLPADIDALVVFDQSGGKITVLTGTAAAIAAARAAVEAGGIETQFAVDARPTSATENEMGE